MRGCTIGVDLGGTKLLAGAVAADGTVLARERREIAGLGLEDVLTATAEAAQAAAAVAGVEVAAAGFGIPSLIDRRRGLSVSCVHLPLDDVPFAALVRERLGVPVAVDNDANCAVLAEWRLGAARGCDHVVLLTLGTGIGGGLVLGGSLYRGSVGAGGELGHVPVDMLGPPCFDGCPGRGCLEALCSGKALERDARAAAAAAPGSPLAQDLAGRGSIGGERVTELARAGDPVAQELLHALGTRLGAGLAGIAMTFNPEVIVVGGGVMGAGELILAPARAELARRALAPSKDVPVVAAELGPEAGMIGAALLAAEGAQ
ncbi:MAG TPA: ROK family protein [Solirubrobacteraceae bacterium]|nr:ROK family protein [Solirubrobacteraceae bacterium]